MILLDTNVLLRFANNSDPRHAVATRALDLLRAVGETLCILPQNLYEFWVAATRPSPVHGLGFTVAETTGLLAAFKIELTLLPDPPNLYDEWESLVTTHCIQGKPAHDARLVAGMRVHGVSRILTFNVADFARFPRLTVIDPATVGVLP